MNLSQAQAWGTESKPILARQERIHRLSRAESSLLASHLTKGVLPNSPPADLVDPHPLHLLSHL